MIPTSLALVTTPPESAAQRAKRLRAEAAQAEHVVYDDMLANLTEAVRLTEEVTEQTGLPDGVRQEAKRLNNLIIEHSQRMGAIMAQRQVRG